MLKDCKLEVLQATQEQLNRLMVIYELTKSILSADDFDELLKKVSEETAKLFNAKGCMIRLIENGMLKIKANYGFPPELSESLIIGVGESLAGKAATEGKTVFSSSPEDFGRISQFLDIRTAICTPLKIGDQIIGTFGLYDKKGVDGYGHESIVPFTDEDQTTLEGFASIAAIVIDKSISYENIIQKEKEALEAKQKFEDLWDHVQGFIQNSADAIVTTDLDGIVTSWNMGAEKMYGYARSEAIGRYMPFVPDFLTDVEKGYAERIGRGEIIEDIETVRLTKAGLLLDVNLTLSPIKDPSGVIIGISGIARDITEKKRIENDVIHKNAVLSKLLMISSAMRGTLELDRLLRMVLTAVTLGDGLGFNRAMLFLLDEDKNVLKGAIGVGPSSHEEAWEVWARLSSEKRSLASMMEEIEKGPLRKDSFMDKLCCRIDVSMESDTILTKALKEKRAFNVTNVQTEPLSDLILIQQLGTRAYAALPLISRDKVIGVLWVDNVYTGKPITELDMEFLKGFTDQMASAIENARLFEHVARAEQELENIFESISDMVYFTSKDHIIMKANKSVANKLGKPVESVIGKKCYEMFHNIDEPWAECPHVKTILSGKPSIEELEDPHLGGTFLMSTSPIFDKDGGLIGTVHIVRDTSELKKLREKVAAAERMAALGAMASKVAHEIRNPLSSIGGFARRLEKQLGSDLKEYAKIIVDEVARLERILNDALSFVRSTPAGKTEFDLDELITGVINLLGSAVADKGNLLTKEIERPVKIRADYGRIKEALINLITNANEATANGTIIVRAYRQAAAPEGSLPAQESQAADAVVEIEDNGCGIKEENLSRIFDPFFTTRTSGTGLGLSITKRIVEDHGGRIEVAGSCEAGAKFKIYIPVLEQED